MAEDVASELDIPSYTFNAGSTPAVAAQAYKPNRSLYSMLAGKQEGDAVHNSYVVKGDLVSANEKNYDLGGTHNIYEIAKTSSREAHDIVNFW